MNKLDLRNNISELLISLKSEQIIKALDGAPEKSALLSLFVDSKSGYDKASIDKNKFNILSQLRAQSVYDNMLFSDIIRHIASSPGNQRAYYLGHNNLLSFYSFHKSLLDLFRILNDLLIDNKGIFEEDKSFNISSNQERGNVIFQIIDDENVSLTKLNIIISSFDKLLRSIYASIKSIDKIELTEYPKIILLDSGSDINFVLNMPKEAAKIISQLIKEAWDFIINHKNYKLERGLETVTKSISVLNKIEEAKNNGIIDNEECQRLHSSIISNTNNIIRNNTVTKQILIETQELSNRELLIEQSKMLLLEENVESKIIEESVLNDNIESEDDEEIK